MGQKALQLTLTNSAATPPPSTRGGGGGTATSNGKCAAGLTSTETAAPTPSSPEITFLSSLPCFDTRPSFFSAIQSLSPSLRSRATRLLFRKDSNLEIGADTSIDGAGSIRDEREDRKGATNGVSRQSYHRIGGELPGNADTRLGPFSVQSEAISRYNRPR